MNERERWIVYPLLFFALGAALRDKYTQQVQTNQLHASHITCEDITVIDADQPDRIVAQLTSDKPTPAGSGSAAAARFGVLILRDSHNNELCGVTNNRLEVKQIACEGVISQVMTIVDPLNSAKVLAELSAKSVPQKGKPPRRIGSLLLTDDEDNAIFGLADDQLKMREIVCESVRVMDPDNGKTLAALGYGMSQPDPQKAAQRIGVLALNNQEFGTLTGVSPKTRRAGQGPAAPPEEPPPTAAESAEKQPPGDGE